MNKKITTNNKTTTTGGPVTEQAPTTNETTAVLPDGYCNGGFMDKDNNILKRAYVDTYAQQLAHMLVNGKPSMKPASFKSAFLADAKRSLKRNVSTEARMLCAASMLTSAKKLTATKKHLLSCATWCKHSYPASKQTKVSAPSILISTQSMPRCLTLKVHFQYSITSIKMNALHFGERHLIIKNIIAKELKYG